MSKRLVAVMDTLLIEIIPAKAAGSRLILCDCCRQRKQAAEFDEDAFGICEECFLSDDLLVELTEPVGNEL